MERYHAKSLFCQNKFLSQQIAIYWKVWRDALCSVNKLFMHEQIIIYVKTIKRIPLFCQNKFLLHKINKSESIRKYQKFLAHQISKSQAIFKVSNEVLCSVRISFVHQINKSHSILKVSSEVLCQCQNKFLVHTTIQSILKVSSD